MMKQLILAAVLGVFVAGAPLTAVAQNGNGDGNYPGQDNGDGNNGNGNGNGGPNTIWKPPGRR